LAPRESRGFRHTCVPLWPAADLRSLRAAYFRPRAGRLPVDHGPTNVIRRGPVYSESCFLGPRTSVNRRAEKTPGLCTVRGPHSPQRNDEFKDAASPLPWLPPSFAKKAALGLHALRTKNCCTASRRYKCSTVAVVICLCGVHIVGCVNQTTKDCHRVAAA